MEEKKYLTKEKIDSIIERTYADLRTQIHGKSEEETIKLVDAENAKIFQLLEENCYALSIHFPHLGSDLRPKPQLVRSNDCPHGKDGMCHACKNLCSYKTEDGCVFAHAVYTGYCLKNPVE